MKHALTLFAFAMLSLSPSFSWASLQVGSQVTMNTNLPGTYGGRFGVTDGGSPAGKFVAPFETFCVEIGQTIGNGTYRVTGIATTNSLNPSLYKLTNYAAWLYTDFREGALSGFNYALSGGAATNDANALQYLIWRQIGFSDATINGATGNSAAAYAALAASKSWLTDYANDASWDKSANYFGNVRIMILETLSGGVAQDQLVLVPEATAVAVWLGLGILGAGAAYWRQTVA